MADGVLTLKERHGRAMDRMARSIVEIDALLTTYAREHDGRFIRYGSTATGRMRRHSDVDIIADFAEDFAGQAAFYADMICAARDIPSDVRPRHFVSDKLMARALAEGVLLS